MSHTGADTAGLAHTSSMVPPQIGSLPVAVAIHTSLLSRPAIDAGAGSAVEVEVRRVRVSRSSWGERRVEIRILASGKELLENTGLLEN